MAGGWITLTVKDSQKVDRQVRFWSSDGTLAGILSASHVVVHTALPRVSISGTITTGGQAQVAAPADPDNAFLEIINPGDAPGSLWINDTGDDAGADADSYELLPGQSYTWPNGVGSAVSVFAATAGHVFKGRKA